MKNAENTAAFFISHSIHVVVRYVYILWVKTSIGKHAINERYGLTMQLPSDVCTRSCQAWWTSWNYNHGRSTYPPPESTPPQKSWFTCLTKGNHLLIRPFFIRRQGGVGWQSNRSEGESSSNTLRQYGSPTHQWYGGWCPFDCVQELVEERNC